MLGDPITDIQIAMEVDYFRLARDRYFVPITVKIPGSDAGTGQGTRGAESTQIDFIGEIKDAKGKVVENVRDYIPVTLKGENAGATLQAPAGVRHGLHAGARHLLHQVPGARERDRQDGHLRAQIRHSRSDHRDAALPISSVVLSSQRQDLSVGALQSPER